MTNQKTLLKEYCLDKSSAADVFYWFLTYSSIPHTSGHCAAGASFIKKFAEERGLRCRMDEALNVIIWKAASPGRENEPAVMLQGHLDMVAAKEASSDFDFLKDSLRIRRDGDFLFAEGTSLGGDNAIAVAYMLALLDSDSLSHPALECVFTADEEIGLIGAAALDCSDLKSTRLINLDTDEEDAFFIGCAGGVRADGRLPLAASDAPADAVGIKLSIKGLLGGHSGADIHKNRANANYLMLGLLDRILARVEDATLAEFSGGLADNAIAAEAEMTLVVETEKKEAVLNELLAAAGELTDLHPQESGLRISFEETAAPSSVWRVNASTIKELITLPQGVTAMSRQVPGLVETSMNLGTVRLSDGALCLGYSVRSSVDMCRDELRDKICSAFTSVGGTCSCSGEYPGWPVQTGSSLQNLCVQLYRELTGRSARLVAVHAGLECGIFCRKLPSLDIISFGPAMFDIHSRYERLQISSVERYYSFIKELLIKII